MSTPSEFPDDMTLGEAREKLRKMAEEGTTCPLCTQNVKVWRRKIHASMAVLLIRMWRAAQGDWVYLPDLPQKSRDGAGLAYWGLIVEATEKREDGGRAGWWKITPPGVNWVLARATVPKYARVYDGRMLNLLGEPVTIQDALGTKFNYRDLMEGR